MALSPTFLPPPPLHRRHYMPHYLAQAASFAQQLWDKQQVGLLTEGQTGPGFPDISERLIAVVRFVLRILEAYVYPATQGYPAIHGFRRSLQGWTGDAGRRHCSEPLASFLTPSYVPCHISFASLLLLLLRPLLIL